MMAHSLLFKNIIYNIMLGLSLLISSHHAFVRSNLRCSNKRIVCLSDQTYKFCFNTAISNIFYGNIKRCPKFTICSEDDGYRPCIKQNVTNNPILLQYFINNQSTISSSTTSKIIGTKESILTHNSAKTKIRTSSTSTPLVISLDKYLVKSSVTPKTNTTQKVFIASSQPSTISVLTNSKKKTPKPNTLKLKNKPKEENLIDKIIKYLKRFKKRQHQKKPIKFPKYPSGIKRTTLRPTTSKGTTKKPMIKRTKKPSKKPTNKVKNGISSVTLNKKVTKSPIPIIESPQTSSMSLATTSSVTLNKKVTKPPIPIIESLQTSNMSLATTPSVTSNRKVTKPPIPIIESPQTSNMSLATTESSSLIRTSQIVSPITIPRLNYTTALTSAPISIQPILMATQKYNTTENSLNKLVHKPCNCSAVILNKNVNTSPRLPCEHLENIFRHDSTVRTTTIATVLQHSKMCKFPAKYPGEHCNEYYECRKTMWWHQIFLKKCNNEESFNVTLSSCQPDKSCTHGY